MADMRDDRPKSEFEERVVSVDRVSYTVAGGRRLRFRALVVVGNRQGKVGMGVAKAGEVAAAIQKAVAQAKKDLITIPLVRETIPHAIQTVFGSARVLLKPAPAGTSVIAGGSVRAVIELAGIKNVRSKVLGSNNKINNVTATLLALKKFQHRSSTVAGSTEVTSSQTEEVPSVAVSADQSSSPSKTEPTTKSATSKAEKKTSRAKRTVKESA